MHVVGTSTRFHLDQGGVVESGLSIYGTSNVRLEDASAMSVLPIGDTMGPKYVVVEKAEDVMKIISLFL
jgi:hypothetical protein